MNWRILLDSMRVAWRIYPFVQLMSIVVLAALFSVISFSMIVDRNFSEWTQSLARGSRMQIVLADEIDSSQVESLKTQLAESQFFSDPHYISKDVAYSEFLSGFGDTYKALADDPLFANPLPNLIEVSLRSLPTSDEVKQQLENYLLEIRKNSAVVEIWSGQETVARYSNLITVIKSIFWLIVLILGTGTAVIYASTIRTSFFRRKEEIEVLDLIGADRLMLLAHFCFEGIILGTVSGFIALTASWWVFEWQRSFLAAHLPLDVYGFYPQFLDFSRGVGLLAMAVLIGLVSAGWAASYEFRLFGINQK